MRGLLRNKRALMRKAILKGGEVMSKEEKIRLTQYAHTAG